MNPEETPLFRKELTGETHKSEGEKVRGREGVVGVKEDKKFWEPVVSPSGSKGKNGGRRVEVEQ